MMNWLCLIWASCRTFTHFRIHNLSHWQSNKFHYVWQVSVILRLCMGKTKPSNKRNQPIEQSNVNGKKLFIDISSPSAKSVGIKYHWLLVLSDCSDNAWSYFLKEKSYLKLNVLALIKRLEAKHGYFLKYIGCDNAGKSLIL